LLLLLLFLLLGLVLLGLVLLVGNRTSTSERVS
jgi:hypothetical protein